MYKPLQNNYRDFIVKTISKQNLPFALPDSVRPMVTALISSIVLEIEFPGGTVKRIELPVFCRTSASISELCKLLKIVTVAVTG